MSVSQTDTLKADALDALHRGQLPEARQFYRSLLETYQRYPYFIDALLALHFNTLLTCLNQPQHREEGQELLRELIALLASLETPTVLSRQLGERLLQLFRYPAQELAPELVEQALELARAQGAEIQPLADLPFVLDECPPPDAFTRLNPEDMVLILYLCVSRAHQIERLPRWLHGLHQRWLSSAPLGETQRTMLEEYRGYQTSGRVHDAYRVLLELFEWAQEHSPSYACEWIIGLAEFDSSPAAERLELLPRYPYERRLYYTLLLYLDLARHFNDEGSAERVSLVLWQEISALCIRLETLIQRRKEKGKGGADDAERLGLLTLYQAEALRAQGALRPAYELLLGPLRLAQRGAFNENLVGARILSVAGDLAEREGDSIRASDHYQAALGLIAPQLLRGAHRPLDEQLQQYLVRQGGERLSLLVKIICALTRLGNDHAVAQLQPLRLIIATLRPELSIKAHAEALLYLELSACRLGDTSAARRSLEAARSLQHRSGVVLSLLYSVLPDLIQVRRSEAPDPGELQRLSTLLWRYSSEARRAGGGEIQRQIALAALLIHLEGAQLVEQRELESRLVILQDMASGGPFNSKSCPLDLFLPKHQELNLEGWIEELAQARSGRIVHRLCVVLRELTRHSVYVTPHRRSASEIQQLHQERFHALWNEEGSSPEGLFRGYNQLLLRPETASWRQRQISPGEFHLEYKVFEQRLLIFLISSESIQLHQQDIVATGLRAQVSELRALLRPGGEDHLLLREVSIELYKLLIEPFRHALSQAHSVLITPDGPLWELPFALLRDRNTFLAQRFDLAIACPTAEPAFRFHNYEAEEPRAALLGGEELQLIAEQFAPILGEQGYQQLSMMNYRELLEHAHEGSTTIHSLYLPGNFHAGQLHSGDEKIGSEELVFALARLNTCCAALPGPHWGEETQQLLRILLTAVQGGLLVQRWLNEPRSGNAGSFLFNFFSRAFSATGPLGLIEAIGSARRAAIESRIPPQYWGQFELYLSDRS